MRWLESAFSRVRLILSAVTLLMVAGVLAWFTMPRQEDAALPDMWGLVVTANVGLSAEDMERLVARPLDDELAHIPQILDVGHQIRPGVVITKIDLRRDISQRAIDDAWDQIRVALRETSSVFPTGTTVPDLDKDLLDLEVVLLAVTGPTDPVELRRAGEAVRDRLLATPGVAEVRLSGVGPEQIVVEYAEPQARRLGLSFSALAAQLHARNTGQPGGAIYIGETTAVIQPHTEYTSLADLRALPVVLPGGQTVPLALIADVRWGPQLPETERARHDAAPALVIGVVPREGASVSDLGAEVRQRMPELRTLAGGAELTEIELLSDRIEARLSELQTSLLTSFLAVGLLLCVTMGARMGLLVAMIVPMVSLATLALYASGGGVLHQMSIAALVLAIGMVVDNAIVIAEAIQRHLDEGMEPRAACVQSVRELAVPLGSATGTTVAAFLPMLLAGGPAAEFVRALPVIICTALLVSYLYAIFVTSVLGRMVLRPSRSAVDPTHARVTLLDRASRGMARLASRRPVAVLAVATALTAVAVVGAASLPEEFFPPSDRNQVFVELSMPEGTALAATDRRTRELETWLLAQPGVAHVTTFIGRGVPRFYYNVPSSPRASHVAQFLITTTGHRANKPLIAAVREYSHGFDAAQIVSRELKQGPTLSAPIEIRVTGDEWQTLDRVSAEVLRVVYETPGAIDARRDLSAGTPVVELGVHDAAAARRGITRDDLARSLFGRTLGQHVGDFRADERPVPIVLRTPEGPQLSLDQLRGADVASHGPSVPLAALADVSVQWRPASISLRNRERIVLVQAEVEFGVAFSEVLARIEPRLATLERAEGVRVQIGGESEGSDEAQGSVIRYLPLGLLTLVVFLLLEFNSFRLTGIVLLTVPLAIIGVVPGLLLTGQSFGFFSLLGAIATVGIVVNNAIVLLDAAEHERSCGATLDAAILSAVQTRIRPILLTSLTTVVGMVPLMSSDTTLWPPLAWAMSSGVLSSTMLTLVVVPAAYHLFRRSRAADGLTPSDGA